MGTTSKIEWSPLRSMSGGTVTLGDHRLVIFGSSDGGWVLGELERRDSEWSIVTSVLPSKVDTEDDLSYTVDVWKSNIEGNL